MSDTPFWALTISFWLHMLATVTWVGGQAILSLIVFPASRKSLSPEEHLKLLTAINRRMRKLSELYQFWRSVERSRRVAGRKESHRAGPEGRS